MLGSILLIVGATYAFFVVFAWLCADKIIYQPKPSSYGDEDFELKLTAADGTKLSSLYLKSSDGASPTILYFHGNNEDLGDIRDHLVAMHQRGLSVFSFDFRGYGATPGRPTEANLFADASTAYDYLTMEAGVPAKSIVVYGRSLGSGPAVELAANRKIGGLILEGAFVSAYRAATQVRILPMDCYENLKKVSRVTAPVLVIHATKDTVVPFHHGRQLFAVANEPKMSLWMDNITHAGFTDEPGDEYWVALDKFAKSINPVD